MCGPVLTVAYAQEVSDMGYWQDEFGDWHDSFGEQHEASWELQGAHWMLRGADTFLDEEDVAEDENDSRSDDSGEEEEEEAEEQELEQCMSSCSTFQGVDDGDSSLGFGVTANKVAFEAAVAPKQGASANWRRSSFLRSVSSLQASDHRCWCERTAQTWGSKIRKLQVEGPFGVRQAGVLPRGAGVLPRVNSM
eukprot:gnl/TRDRNA2_/TRDRNA2_43275_c0_seq1.p1 gnl/TRDRNA2_/TRDRNA2_43275_c0~~gnl/TRDRNA2_/TRDRNA2_43275_c0_seq1.p1  ORF type:complete len:193 (+),score=43.47 gnl/TRDRNA2_/TRDRNA2_43275_c0_seq1:64-642(+)